MPSTAEDARLDLRSLTDAAGAEVVDLFDFVRGASPDEVRDALIDVLPALGDAYGDGAAVLAADWFDEMRGAAGARGSFVAAPSIPVDSARWESLARWSVAPLYAAAPDLAAASVLAVGGLQRTVADRHRLTVVDNSIRDPQAAGWSRVGVGGNCGFCNMLIARGDIYTESSVTFRSHDHCNCAASPTWAKNVVKVSGEPFKQSKRNRSEATKKADNARAYEFIANQ